MDTCTVLFSTEQTTLQKNVEPIGRLQFTIVRIIIRVGSQLFGPQLLQLDHSIVQCHSTALQIKSTLRLFSFFWQYSQYSHVPWILFELFTFCHPVLWHTYMAWWPHSELRSCICMMWDSHATISCNLKICVSDTFHFHFLIMNSLFSHPSVFEIHLLTPASLFWN